DGSWRSATSPGVPPGASGGDPAEVSRRHDVRGDCGGVGRASGVDLPGVASPRTAATSAVQTLATRETSPRLRATARTSPRGRAPLEGAQSGTCTGDPQARECALAGARAARGGVRRLRSPLRVDERARAAAETPRAGSRLFDPLWHRGTPATAHCRR